MIKIADRSDEDLMTLYQGGDYVAFEYLYERHSGRVYHYLSGKVSADVAKDLLQDIFLKIHRSRSQYSSQYPFLPWLFTVARNTLTDFFKLSESNAVKVEIDLDNLAISELPNASGHDLAAVLRNLPILQRQAIELRYMNDWSFEMIAEEMKTTPENSRQIISRGLKKMRSLLQGGKK